MPACTDHILVPLDGSALAEQAIGQARQIGSSLILIRCRTLPARGDVFLPPSMVRVPDVETPEIKEYLDHLAAGLRGEGLEVETVVGSGSPVEAIVAEAARARMIVITSHGRSGIRRMLLGSVAEGVVRSAPCPVLVVGGQVRAPGHGFKNILVPLDGSDTSELALGEARRVALESQATVHLIRVLVTSEGDHSLPTVAAAHAAEEKAALEYLEACAVRLQGVQVELHCPGGPAEVRIQEAVEGRDIDLIVMSTHGRSGWGRWLFGSVAEAVVRRATCPVLLVRPAEVTA